MKYCDSLTQREVITGFHKNLYMICTKELITVSPPIVMDRTLRWTKHDYY